MIKRFELRFNSENPREAEIMQKIEDRDQNMYRHPKDYIIQALYELENKKYKEQVLRRIIQEELEKAKQRPDYQDTVEERCEEDMVKTDKKIEMDPDLLKYLG